MELQRQIMSDDYTVITKVGVLRELFKAWGADLLATASLRDDTVVSNTSPLLLDKQGVQDLTNWSDGTFYKKVSELPEGIVIRRSKRLLINREKFLDWLFSQPIPHNSHLKASAL